MLSGASLTTEKTYLMGKFAHMCLRTANIDYNGRLCMVSAAAGNKKAFGIDRAANPWSDILGADVILVSGANIAECAPITTNYVWQAREHGREGHRRRSAHHADRADVRPVPAGQAGARHGALQRHPAPDDRARLARSRVHREPHGRVRCRRGSTCASGRRSRTAEVTGIAEKTIRQAAEWWGTAKTSFLCHARGLEHHSNGVKNVMSAINIVLASGRIGRPNCGYATITGQGNGQGGREHGQKCDQLPGGRDLANPEHRAYVAGVWGMDPADLPQPGVDAYEIIRKIDTGEIKGLLSLCFNPVVSLPDNNFVRQALEKLDYYVAIDFFMSESARYATSSCRARFRKRTKAPSRSSKGGSSRSTRRSSARARRGPTGRSSRTSRRPWAASRGSRSRARARSSRSCASPPRAGSRTTPGLPTSASRRTSACSGRVRATCPRAYRCQGRRARRACSSPDHGTRSPRAPARSISPTARPAWNVTPYVGPAEDVDEEYPDHPDHRARRQPVPVREPDAAHRPARRSLSGAADRDAPAAGGAAWHCRRRLDDGREPPRQLHAARVGRDDDPARHGSSSRTTGPAARAPTS